LILFTQNHTRIWIALFFCGLLALGLLISKDYGLSWDEPIQRHLGQEAWNYAIHQTPDYWKIPLKNLIYGVSYEMLLAAGEQVLHISDTKDAFLFRHAAQFVLFWVTIVCFYFLCLKRFKKEGLAILGCVFLLLSPRIFAEAFYNTKDLGFLCFFFIAVYTGACFLEKPTLPRALIHGLASAFAIDVRLLGFLAPCLTSLFLMLDLLFSKKTVWPWSVVRNYFIFLGALAFFTVLFWPFLWPNPLHRLIVAIKMMSRFPWAGSTTLYLGSDANARTLPWHFLPLWISITTPIAYLFFFLVGTGNLLANAFKKKMALDAENRLDLLFFGCFFLPLVSVLIAHPTLYDSWRHFYFIYPFLILLALRGCSVLWNLKSDSLRRIRRPVIVFLIAAQMVLIAFFMIRNHPFQNVYFNRFAGKSMTEIRSRFEMDYWGLSYRRAFEKLLSEDPSDPIKVSVPNEAGTLAVQMLSPEDRARVQFTWTDQADYFLGNYRWHKEEYEYKNKIFSIDVDGTPILSVYRLR